MAAAAARKEVYMMENAGFAVDDTKVTVVEVETSLPGQPEQNSDIQAAVQSEEVVPAVAASVCGPSHCNPSHCEEARVQTTCKCDVQQPNQKVEFQTWVHPKGWVLLGTGLCLMAWIVVYFTVTHFYQV